MQPLVALRAITRLVKNPNETREVFTIIRALSGSDLEKGLKRFQATEPVSYTHLTLPTKRIV